MHRDTPSRRHEFSGRVNRARFALGNWVLGPEEVDSFSRKAVVGAIGLIVLGTLIMLFRIPSGLRNELWAEDASVFVTGALGSHPTVALFVPYAGYMHAFPRVVAFLAVLFVPLSHVPYAVTLVACGLASSVATLAFVVMRQRIPSVYPRLLLWLALVTIPIAGIEVNGSIANSHWYLLVGLFAILITRQQSVPLVAISAIVVFFAVGSDPLSAILLPLIVVRFASLRSRRDAWIPGVYLAFLVMQLVVDSMTRLSPARTHPTAIELFRTLGFRDFLQTLAGQSPAERLYGELGDFALILATVVIVALVIAVVWKGGQLGGLSVVALVASVSYLVFPAWIRWFPQFDPAAGNPSGGSRYSIVPIALAVISIVAFVEMMLTSRLPRAFRWLPLIVVGALFVAITIPDFQESSRSADHPWSAEVAQAINRCHFEGPQHAVVLPASPAKFAVTTTCGILLKG